jgi:hypothetical protein
VDCGFENSEIRNQMAQSIDIFQQSAKVSYLDDVRAEDERIYW